MYKRGEAGKAVYTKILTQLKNNVKLLGALVKSVDYSRNGGADKTDVKVNGKNPDCDVAEGCFGNCGVENRKLLFDLIR